MCDIATVMRAKATVSRGKEPVALVRLHLAKALIGVAEANALAATRSRSSAVSGPGRSRRPRRWHCGVPTTSWDAGKNRVTSRFRHATADRPPRSRVRRLQPCA
jgi:hypothetical protein